MDVRVVDHPLAKARLSTMRDARTDNAAFRAALRDLTLMLVYEAMREAPLRTAPIHSPVARTLCYSLAQPPLLVLDPMLATGGSMVYTIELLTARGATDVTSVCVLAAPEGIARLRGSGLPVRLVTASVDERLNDSAYIVPGLGDAGDRQFGAV